MFKGLFRNEFKSEFNSPFSKGAVFVTLNNLTLSANTVVENTGAGVVVATVIGKTNGSTVTLSNNAGGRFVISGDGTTILTGLVATDFETATSHVIELTETLAGATNSPRTSTATINVTNVFDVPVVDTFTNTNGTLVTAHTGESGYSWVNAGATVPTSYGQVLNNRVYATVFNRLRQNYTIPTANYAVKGKFRVLQSLDASLAMGIMGRTSSTEQTFYNVVFGSQAWTLSRFNNGVQTIATTSTASYGNGDDVEIILSMVGSLIEVYINGLKVITWNDPNPITSAGSIGFLLPPSTATSGAHLDEIFAIPVENIVPSIPALQPLQLTSNTIIENSPNDTVVGNLFPRQAGSSLSLTNNAGGRFKLTNNRLLASTTPTDFETASSHSITIRETLVDSPNSPRDTTLTISVTDATELISLTLSSSTVIEYALSGTVVGTLQGVTSGSTLSLTSDGGGRFSLSGNNIVTTSTPTDFEVATSHTITVRETLTGVINSPRDTNLSITVTKLLDNITTLASYALRRTRSAYTGNAIRVRRSNDNVEADIPFATSGQTRQNYIQNPTFAEAVAGTPGTFPTNYASVDFGNTSSLRQIVGTGVTTNGLPYMDFRVVGTPTTTGQYRLQCFGETTQGAPVTVGQRSLFSVGLVLQAGALTNTSINLRTNERTSAGALLTSSNLLVVPTTTERRFSQLVTASNASCAITNTEILINLNAGLAVNFTLRIICPNLESQRQMATIPLLTTALTTVAKAGELDLNALEAHVGANSGFIASWYDQSGNVRNATQTNTNQQPRIVNAGVLDVVNFKPAPTASGGQVMNFANIAMGNNPFTLSQVNYLTGTISNNQDCVGDGITTSTNHFNGSYRLFLSGVGDVLTSSATRATNTMETSMIRRISSTSGDIHQNGTRRGSSTTINSSGIVNFDQMFAGIGGSMSGALFEVIIIELSLTDAQRQLIERNQGVYYGITVA